MPTNRSRAKRRIILIHDNLDAAFFLVNKKGGNPRLVDRCRTQVAVQFVDLLSHLGFKVECFDTATQPVENKADKVLDIAARK